jgi:aspartyl-tRNA(Asn)/glutamyl-tRNA(Gln) amidotransferase subunit A
MAPWAIGTDTGGSVRIPAAWNGVTGLKTTIGRISTFGVLPLSPTLDTPGPITRDIEDAALLLAVLQGEDRCDRRTLGVHDVDPMPNLHRGVKGLRLAQLPANERDGIDAEVLAAYDRSVDALGSMGCGDRRCGTARAVHRSRRDQRTHHVGRGVRGAGGTG